MSTDTREHFLTAATQLFAEKGFYGASIANIADELGLTKQTLLHHFGSKEKLYGEVLQRVCNPMIAAVDGAGNIRQALQHISAICLQNQASTQLLMRELLDNRRRADTAKNWYLKPFLERLITLLQAKDTSIDRVTALTRVYQILGAVNYFAISGPTLTQMFGAQDIDQMTESYSAAMQRLIDRLLAAGD